MARPKKLVPHKQYLPSMVTDIIKHFNVDPYKEITNTKGEIKTVPNDCPHIVELLKKWKLSPRVWNTFIDPKNRDLYPELQDAWETSKMLQERFVDINASRGASNAIWSIFKAKNQLGWTDKADINMKPQGNTWAGLVKGSNKRKEDLSKS